MIRKSNKMLGNVAITLVVLGLSWFIPAASATSVTNWFSFSNTTLLPSTGPVSAASGVLSISGGSLAAGDQVVFDGIVQDVPGSGPDAWGAVELNAGPGYLGLVNATLGVLAETGTNSGNPCQLFLNGASSSTTFGTAQGSQTNRVRIQLTCTQSGSTTNMSYVVQIDQGGTGTFSGSLSGTGVTFAGNTITLSFGANNQYHQFEQTLPVVALAGTTTVAAGAAATFTAVVTQGYPWLTSQQWVSNGVPISGATNLTYTTPVLAAAASGTQYGLRAGNRFTGFTIPALIVTVRSVPGLVPFLFNPTAMAAGTQANPLMPPSVIPGSYLLAGDTVVVDSVVTTNGPFAASDGWAAINLAAGGFEGVTTAQLGLLVRLGTGASQLFVNGGAFGANPSSSGALTNRARIQLYPSRTGSTTNMGWEVQLDPNLTGTFLPAVVGTNLTFPGNVIPLSFAAYDVPGLVTPLPVGLLAFHQVLTATNLPVGAFDQVLATEDYLNLSNVVVAASAPGLAYASSNPQAVTVSASGYLSAVGVGQSVITTTLGTLAASNLVTVVNAGALLAARVVVTNSVPLYTNQSLTVTGNFAGLTNVNLLRYGQTTFVIGNTNLLTISPAGVITPLAPGTTPVSAINSGVTSPPVLVTVTYPANQFIFDTFGDGYWTIVNQGNTNSLVVSSGGASQFTATNTAADAQFELLYNLQNSTFRLRNRASELCIGAVSNAVVPVDYTATPAEQWYLITLGGGYYRIVNAATGLALQTDNGRPARVTLTNAAASPFQAWTMVYQTHYPKKGCAGYENMYAALGLQWAYNYDDNTGTALPANVNFVPMIHDGVWEPLGDVQARTPGWLAQAEPDYLLTYNEPDNPDQANMSTNEVIGLWPDLQALNVPLVSPSMQTTFGPWIYNFYTMITNRQERVDYTAVHEYVPPNAGSLLSSLQSVYTTWGRPVWLTEFSPVDWSNTKSWSEDDDYNFLAEFMWQAEDQDWLKRYAIFPFSATNSANPWVDNGYIGAFFTTGTNLSPYGELYAAWDADRALEPRTAYLLHNLATSFRLTDTKTLLAPQAASIYTRNATTEWGLLPAVAGNHWYIISLNDGRRLRDVSGTLSLAPFGFANSTVEWEFNGPDSSGYYFITNTAGHSLNTAGSDPGITINTAAGTTQNNNTRWRLVKAWQPVAVTNSVPAGLAFAFANPGIALAWAPDANVYYRIYRAVNNGGPYSLLTQVATNSYVDTTASTNSLPYYYVVTGLDAFGDESAYSTAVAANPGELWRQEWFGTLANTGNAADTANPAGDGIINLLKRAFNLNPLTFDTNGVPSGALNGGVFTLTYQQNLAATDLMFQVQSSPDLVTWSATNVTDVTVSTNGSTAIHHASVPVASAAQFLRLQVTEQP